MNLHWALKRIRKKWALRRLWHSLICKREREIFVQMAFKEAINHHSGLWLLLTNIILSRTCSKFHLMIELKIVKWKIAWKKIKDFADLVKDAKSIAGFSLAINFKLDWMMSHKHGRVAKRVSKWQPPKSIFQDKFLGYEVLQWLKLWWVEKLIVYLL